MLLIALIGAAAIGGAPAPAVPMHVFSPRVLSAPPASRPISAPPAAQPALKPPPLKTTPGADAKTTPNLAHRDEQRRLPLSQCYVSRNEAGVGVLYGIAVAPPSPALACPEADIPFPPLPF